MEKYIPLVGTEVSFKYLARSGEIQDRTILLEKVYQNKFGEGYIVGKDTTKGEYRSFHTIRIID